MVLLFLEGRVHWIKKNNNFSAFLLRDKIGFLCRNRNGNIEIEIIEFYTPSPFPWSPPPPRPRPETRKEFFEVMCGGREAEGPPQF